MKIKSLVLATAASLVLSVSAAFAGPFIIAGTDSEDHGSASGGANNDGWLFMQKALENIGGGVTNGNKVVTVLGSSGGQAGAANASAFGLSSLVAAGWTINTVDGTTNITNFFNGTGASNTGNTGIIMIDSGDNTVGGISGAEDAILTANAAAINTFVGAGGGLFAQASMLGWLSALIPGIVTVDVGGGGDSTALLLTAAGTSAFPGLTNGDLSSGPWHHYFTGYSPLSLLAESSTGFDVIIGGVGGSITDPGPIGVPEPLTVTLFGAGLAGAAALRRRKAKKA